MSRLLAVCLTAWAEGLMVKRSDVVIPPRFSRTV